MKIKPIIVIFSILFVSCSTENTTSNKNTIILNCKDLELEDHIIDYCIKHDYDIIYDGNNREIVDSIKHKPYFMSQTPEEGLWEALSYYGVKFPGIVYDQAILETEHFTSDVCKINNNLFGLYNSANEDYYCFEYWWESVIAYKELIQYEYFRDENTYYSFLKNLPYAEDPEYINKLKQLRK